MRGLNSNLHFVFMVTAQVDDWASYLEQFD